MAILRDKRPVRLLSAMAVALVTVLIIFTAVSFAGKFHFVYDNLSNFKWHYAIGFLISIPFLALGSRKFWLGIALIGLAINIVQVVPWYLVEPGRPAGAEHVALQVLVSNVRLDNTRYDRLDELIAEEAPDVVGLIEVTEAWLANLPVLRQHYPYGFEAPRHNYFGLALYSKYPLSDAKLRYFGKSTPPAITATLTTGGRSVEVILAHPLSPVTRLRAYRRNTQLREMAEYVAAIDRPVILAADLNITMWSPHYDEFVELAGLRNSRKGSGIAATWPASRSIAIPIDHVLYTDPLRLEDFRVHESIGSDHLPISATILLDNDTDSAHVDAAVN